MIRLCCSQEHLGVTCPDGLVMCCLCFERVTREHLAVDPDGHPENVCLPCRADEIEQIRRIHDRGDHRFCGPNCEVPG